MASITLIQDFTPLLTGFVWWISSLGLIAAYYNWLRGETISAGGWIPTSPLFITSKKTSLYICGGLAALGFYLLIIRSLDWGYTNLVVEKNPALVHWYLSKGFPLPGRLELSSDLIKISYTWNGGRRSAPHFRYYLTFANGRTLYTADITSKSAREFQKFIITNAPAAKWRYDPFFN